MGIQVSPGLDRHGLEVLDRHECLALLGEEHVGRLGFSADALPVIFPVNYVIDGTSIYFRTEDGQKLKAARDRSVACLEIDRFDRFGHSGFSVLATGRLELVGPEREEALGHLAVTPWAFPDAPHLIELSIELVSGRRIHHPPSSDGHPDPSRDGGGWPRRPR